jgi:hypothetical protein
MMTERGHTIYHYGHEESDVICTEHISVTDNAVLQEAYGNHDWKKNFFQHNTADHAHKTFNIRAIAEVGKRVQKNDFALCFWGYAHQPIFEAYRDKILTPVHVLSQGFATDLNAKPSGPTDFKAKRAVLLNISGTVLLPALPLSLYCISTLLR